MRFCRTLQSRLRLGANGANPGSSSTVGWCSRLAAPARWHASRLCALPVTLRYPRSPFHASPISCYTYRQAVYCNTIA